MADVLREFLVSVGFAADESQAKKVEATVAKTETKITQTQTAEGAKRTDASQGEATARVTIAEALTRLIALEEQKLSDARERIRKQDAERDKKAAEDAAKKATERREQAVKSMQAGALKLAAFAVKAIAAVEGAALGIVYAADKAAKAAERLNYSAQMMGASAKGINAVEYAVSQLGGSIEGAHTSLDALGKRMLHAPDATIELLDSLKVQTRDAQGHILSTERLWTNLMDTLGKKPYREGVLRAEALGTDEQTFRAATNPRFHALEQEQRRIQGNVGADADDAAKSGTAFEGSMRRLKETLDAIATRVETGLFKVLQPQLDKLAEWAEQHGGQIADIVSRIALELVKLAGSVIDHLSKVNWDPIISDIGVLADKFVAVANAIQGTTDKMIAFGAAIQEKLIDPVKTLLGYLGKIDQATTGNIGNLTDNIKSFLGFAKKVDDATATNPAAAAHTLESVDQGTSADVGDAKAKAGGLWGWFKGLVGLDTAEDRRVKDAILQTAESTKKLVEKAGGIGGDGDGGGGSGGGVPNMRYGRGPGGAFRGTPGSSLASGGEGGTASWRNNNPGNISAGKFAREHGADGSNGRWAHFPDYATGRKAQEDLWFNSDLYKGKTLSGAVTQWSPPNENDTAGLIRKYAAATGVDPSTPLSRFTPEQRAKLLDAQQAAEGWRAGKRTNTVSSAASTAAVAGDSPEVAEARRYLAQTATGAAAQRSDSIVNLNPAFALAAAKAIKQARAEGINAGIFSGYRKPTQTGSNYDANGLSSHSYGIASDFSGIGTAGSATARRFDEIARAAGLGGYGPFNRREFNHKELGLHLEKDLARLARMRATLGPDGYMRDPKATWAASGYVLPAGAKETFPQVAKAPPTPLAGRTLGGLIHDGGGYAMKPQGEPLKVEVTKADQLAEIAKRASEHADATKIVARALAARAFGGNPLMPHIRHPIGVTPAMHVSMDQSRRRGDTHVAKTENYHFHGGTGAQMLAEARRTAGRGNADLIRNLQTAEV